MPLSLPAMPWRSCATRPSTITARGEPSTSMSSANSNVRTRDFRALFAGLPPPIQRTARAAFRTFLFNPAHPALRHHALEDTHRGRHQANSFSVSITMQYRAIYAVDDDVNVWYWIGTHNDYESF